MRKRRTREHVIADLSVNHVERLVLRCGWTVERVQHDYGLDLIMRTYSASGQIQSGSIWFQLKATEHMPRLRGNRTIPIRVEWRDLLLWVNEPMPVILIVYDAVEDRAYWLHVQEYFRGRGWAARMELNTSVRVYVPAANILDETAVRSFARLRDDCLSSP
jgi:Domain of unknown function (DUF4365)